jgi:hypothetical protein
MTHTTKRESQLGDEATHLHHFLLEWLSGYSIEDKQTWLAVLLREAFRDNPKDMSVIIVMAAQQLGFEV